MKGIETVVQPDPIPDRYNGDPGALIEGVYTRFEILSQAFWWQRTMPAEQALTESRALIQDMQTAFHADYSKWRDSARRRIQLQDSRLYRDVTALCLEAALSVIDGQKQ